MQKKKKKYIYRIYLTWNNTDQKNPTISQNVTKISSLSCLPVLAAFWLYKPISFGVRTFTVLKEFKENEHRFTHGKLRRKKKPSIL